MNARIVSILILVVTIQLVAHRSTVSADASKLDESAADDNVEQVNPTRSGMYLQDDDHSNVELDKVGDSHKYDLISGETGGISSSLRGQEAYNLAKLIAKMMTNRNNNLQEQSERKRLSQRNQLADSKEDKDYTFVGINPVSKYSGKSLEPEWSGSNSRDMLLDGQSFRLVPLARLLKHSSFIANCCVAYQLSLLNMNRIAPSKSHNLDQPKRNSESRQFLDLYIASQGWPSLRMRWVN